jgi:hypothetical protein
MSAGRLHKVSGGIIVLTRLDARETGLPGAARIGPASARFHFGPFLQFANYHGGYASFPYASMIAFTLPDLMALTRRSWSCSVWSP